MNVMELMAEDLAQLIDLANANMKTIPGPVFNVKGYDAKGDGITGDGVSIQKATDAASAAGGGTVFFPAGTYILDAPIAIPSKVTLEGEGPRLSILKLKTNMSSAGMPNFGGIYRPIYNTNYATGDTDIALRNLGFDGNGANQTVAIAPSFKKVTRCQISNCRFTGFGNLTPLRYAQGFVFFESVEVDFTHNEIDFNAGDGIAFSDLCMRLRIGSNYSHDNNDYGLIVTGGGEDITFNGNICKYNRIIGIGLDKCQRANVTGNECSFNGVGISFLKFGGETAAYPVNEIYSCTGNVCFGNTIYGMELNRVRKLVVSGNTITGNNEGIHIQETQSIHVIANNISNNAFDGILLISFDAAFAVGFNYIALNYIYGNGVGIHEVNSGGTVNASSLFCNEGMEENTTGYTLLVSKFTSVKQNGAMVTNQELDFDMSLKATSATAGTAAALPATPDGYLIINIGGAGKKIPYYTW